LITPWQRLYGPSRYPLVQIVGRAARKMVRTAERLRDSIHVLGVRAARTILQARMTCIPSAEDFASETQRATTMGVSGCGDVGEEATGIDQRRHHLTK
jgi:hypothetical protein